MAINPGPAPMSAAKQQAPNTGIELPAMLPYAMCGSHLQRLPQITTYCLECLSMITSLAWGEGEDAPSNACVA